MSNETRHELFESLRQMARTLTDALYAFSEGVPYIPEALDQYEWDLGTLWNKKTGEPVDDPETSLPYEVYDAEEYLLNLPLEVIDERGRLFTVVFATGGPHIEMTQDGAFNQPILAGYWGGEKVTLSDPILEQAMEYYIPEMWTA